MLESVRGAVALPEWHDHSFTVRIVAGGEEATPPNGRRPDALWHTDAGEEIAVEVRHRNAKDEAYADDMAAIGAPALKVRVSDLDVSVTRPRLMPQIAAAASWVAGPFEPFHQQPPPSKTLGVQYLPDRVVTLEGEARLAAQRATRQVKERRARKVYAGGGFVLRDNARRRDYNSVVMVIPVQFGEHNLEDDPKRQPFVTCGAWRMSDEGRLSPIENPEMTLEQMLGLYSMASRAQTMRGGKAPIANGAITELRNGNWKAFYKGLRITAYKDRAKFGRWRCRFTIENVVVDGGPQATLAAAHDEPASVIHNMVSATTQ